jgi:hypothetical protein
VCSQWQDYAPRVSELFADLGVFVVAASLLSLMLLLSRRVQSGFVLWMINVVVTFCLFFLVVAVANLLTALFGRDPARTEGGEWVLGVVFGAVTCGWFVRSYVHAISEQTRQRILASLVGVAIISATLVNVALSPRR